MKFKSNSQIQLSMRVQSEKEIMVGIKPEGCVYKECVSVVSSQGQELQFVI